MLAHLFKTDKGRYLFSGHNACGDPFEGAGFRRREDMTPRPFAAVVDVGREFILTPEGDLYIIGSGQQQFSTWTPTALVAAARQRWFGFSVKVADDLK